MSEQIKCPTCEDTYSSLGSHWVYNSSCEHPTFTDKQIEIITGLLMGDGNIHQPGGRNPYLRCNCISQNYLKYIDNKFDVLGLGVTLKISAKDNANLAKNTGFNPKAEEENYSDQYIWRSRRHPQLKEFKEWYKSGEKVYPENIKLTPTTLKHWYCGDGNLSSGSNIRIALSNEMENKNKINKLFKRVNLPAPSNYDITERKSHLGGKRCYACFTVEQSNKLFKYMGRPLPDFEYKWPEKFN